MKSERRHELQSNKLAEILEQNAEKVRPYSRALLGGLILVVAVIAVLLIWRSREQSARETAWSDFFAAVEFGERDELSQIAENYPDTNAGLWARFMFADGQVAEGLANLYRDHELGRESLELALDTWGTLLNGLSTSQQNDPLLAGRAHLQMGKVEEALQHFDSAKEHYQFVIDKWPDHAVGKRAEQALELIEQGDTESFYTNFYRARPPSAPATGDAVTPPVGQQPFEASETPDFGTDGFEYEPLEPDFGQGDPLPGADLDTESDLPLEDGESALPSTDESGSETPAADTATDEPPAPGAEVTDSLPLDAPATEEPSAPATE